MQRTSAAPARPADGGPQTRASDADRDRAAGLLNAAFAEGGLTADEHGERLDTVYAARTWWQLRQLTADLPGTSDAATEPTAAPGMFAGADWCLLCVLLIVCPPAGIAWWVLSRRRPHADPGRPPTPADGAAAAAESP
jgi:Domain of unknown function (DUF1707)